MREQVCTAVHTAGAGAQVAFYGGSFTAIPRARQEAYLKAIADLPVTVRLSTRPDAIDSEVLTLLSHFPVETIELGAQSMSDRVLACSGRGHTAEDTRRASAQIQKAGFSLILQAMCGLPEDGGTWVDTAREIAALEPDGVRIYPVVVIRDTKLYDLWKAGQYTPLTPEEGAHAAADMLEDMDGKIDGIFDGGPCGVGVESTIIDLTCQPPRLLRAGGLPLEELERVLGTVLVDKCITQLMTDGERPRAPGMKYRHYAPKAPVTVVTGDGKKSAAYIAAHAPEGAGVICFSEFRAQFPGCVVHELGPEGDKSEQARRVFDALREFDATDVTEIFAQCPDDAGLGLAIGNRLKKAAGFHVVEV